MSADDDEPKKKRRRWRRSDQIPLWLIVAVNAAAGLFAVICVYLVFWQDRFVEAIFFGVLLLIALALPYSEGLRARFSSKVLDAGLEAPMNAPGATADAETKGGLAVGSDSDSGPPNEPANQPERESRQK